METVPERLRDFAATGLYILTECSYGAYRYLRGPILPGRWPSLAGRTDFPIAAGCSNAPRFANIRHRADIG